MRLPRPFDALLWSSLASLAALGCGAAPDPAGADGLGSVGQAQDNGGTSEPDRCTVTRDSDGQSMGEGTVDQNGFCCVPNSNGSQTCYGCGSGYSCASIPSTTKDPRKPPIFVPPPSLPVKR